MSGDIFGCHNGVEGRGCATGIWWVESMDDAKHPSMHRTAPTRENNLTPDVNCTKLRNSVLQDIRKLVPGYVTFWAL